MLGTRLVLCALVAFTVACTPVTTPASAPAPTTAPTYELALISAACNRLTSTSAECNGSVRNLMDQPIADVEAVITWYDDYETALQSDAAFIDQRSLRAGQESSWKVRVPSAPALMIWKVAFKRPGGSTIVMRDDR